MHLIHDIFSFAGHRLSSRRWDRFHSPYLYRLFSDCCDEQNQAADFDRIESIRADLLNSKERITPKDFGAGHQGRVIKKEIPISTIAHHSLSSPFQCRFMARLTRFHQPRIVVEFGTSLGISASYLACGSPTSRIITVEGDPLISDIAKNIFAKLGINNIEINNTSFENYIEEALPFLDRIDLLFLDGNHRKEPLLSYFQAVKSKLHEDTIIIVDDIHWSTEMKSAWKEIIHSNEVTQSVDCFHFGLLFFTPQFMAKEHHVVHLPLNALKRK
jgi:predicted O-methyltransferase YrrM